MGRPPWTRLTCLRSNQSRRPPARDRWCLSPPGPRHAWRARPALAGQHVVDAPADVALAHVPPRRPPREHVLAVGIERASHVDQPSARIRSNTARSSGRWPIAPGFRSFGCRSRSVCATLRSPQSTSGCPRVTRSEVQRPDLRETASSPGSLSRRSARTRMPPACRRRPPWPCASRSRTADGRTSAAARDLLADEHRDARVPARAVPVAP